MISTVHHGERMENEGGGGGVDVFKDNDFHWFLSCSCTIAQINRWNMFWLILSNVFSWKLMKSVRSKCFLAYSGLTLRPRSSTWGWSCRSSGRVPTWLTRSWRCLLELGGGRPHHLFAEKRNKKKESVSLYHRFIYRLKAKVHHARMQRAPRVAQPPQSMFQAKRHGLV